MVELIRRYERMPQSMEKEFHLVGLRWAEETIVAQRQVKVLALAKILFEAFYKNGSAAVILPGGQQLQEPSPPGVGAVGVWNARQKAVDMAERATPWDRF